MKTKRPLSSYLTPSIADIFFAVILLYLCLKPNAGLLGDGDTGYHIRAGEYIIDTLSVPNFDLFSFHTPVLPWTAHEWLAEVIMAALHTAFGMNGVIVFYALLLALTTYLLFKILRAYQAGVAVAIVITVLAETASQIHWLARPHVFSFLFMILFHYVLESWRRERFNRLFLLPPMMLFWVNLHGGFLGGFILIGAYIVGSMAGCLTGPADQRSESLERLKQLAVPTAACLAASMCNPQGYRILLFPFRLVGDKFMMDHISEFLSPDFHEMATFKYLLLVVIGVLALSRRKLEVTELVLLLIFTNMALYSARYIPLFALITAPILTRNTEGAGQALGGKTAEFFRKRFANIARIDSNAAGFLWPALALVIAVAGIHLGKVQHGFDPKMKAVAATEFLLRERIPGHMYNDDEFGDYMIYRSYPAYRVFFDGRSDMYGAAMVKEYNKVANFEEGWEKVLEKYGITWIFFGTNTRLSRFLLKDSSWKLIYSDKVASIFVKDLPQYRQLIEKYRGVRPAVVAETSK